MLKRVVLALVLFVIVCLPVRAEPTARLIFHNVSGFWGSFGEGCASDLGLTDACDGIDIFAHRHYANFHALGGTMGDWLDHDFFKVYARNAGTEWQPKFEAGSVLVAFLGQDQGSVPEVEIYPAAKGDILKTV
jgi:hypothetical protein